jgi:hypothetical protein
MKFKKRFGMLVIAAAVCSFAVALLSSGAVGQDEGWRIIRADYGSKTQRVDVTALTKALVARGGDGGKVPINNITMGGDPAVDQDKWLRIEARGRRSEEREFTFKEHTYLEVRLFDVRHEDADDRPANYGGRDRDQDDNAGLRIVRAYYGVQGRTVDVAGLLRDRIRGNTLSLVVTNGAMGGDPAIGYDKVLIVVYRVQGRETATAVPEGNTLTIP